MCIVFEETQSKKLFAVINVYRNPLKDKNYWELLKKAIDRLMDKNLNTIVCGSDFNCHTGNNSLMDTQATCNSNITLYRNSQDNTVDKEGLKLIDLMDEYSLNLLNGRTNGDENGNYT